MNPSNVWWLAEIGDDVKLRQAIQRLPSCVDVCGWSYDQSGLRRGVAFLEGRWVVGTHPASFAAPILYYAICAGSPSTVSLALSSGADPTISLGGTNPLSLADSLPHPFPSSEIKMAILAAIERKNDPLSALRENEAYQRSDLVRVEEELRNKISQDERQGTVTINVEIRGFGFERSRHTISFPKSGSLANFREKVESVAKCRVVISYMQIICPPTANTSSTDKSRLKPLSVAVEITSKTFHKFMAQKKHAIIARPVTYSFSNNESNSSEDNVPNKTRISKDILEYCRSPKRSTSRLDVLRRDLDNEERSFHTEKNQIQYKRKVLTPEQLEEATQRLYTIPLARRQQQQAEFDDEIQQSIDLSTTKINSRRLEEGQEESVNRLYGWAAERDEKIAKMDEDLWASLPQPPITEMESEEREVILARLTSNTKSQTLKQLEEKLYPQTKRKKLSREKQKKLNQSTFYDAVQKRADKLKCVEEEFGDFRSRKQASAKITPEGVAAMATRLSTRK